MLAAAVCTGCATPFLDPLPEWRPIAAPDTARVERVLLLVGDAGDVTIETSPLLQQVAKDVEAWSSALRRDSAVSLVYLGDNVYPEGVRDASDPLFTQDSARLEAQVATVAGRWARRHRAAAYFVPGNHDWGNMRGEAGVQRLRNEEAFLARRKQRGIAVGLVPPAGRPGPVAVDVGRHLRFLFLDTAWWLFNYTNPQKISMLVATDAAMRGAGDRTVLIFAHHPFQSGGSHGGLVPFWETIGVRYLLARSGTLLQDLNSIPYRELHDELENIFHRTKFPLAWIGGHDHSLQVIRAAEKGDPPFMLASGSGSKLTDVGDTEGQLFRKSAPGYMTLVFKLDGGIDLYVTATADELLKCDQVDTGARARCMEDGVAAFETIYSMHMK